MPFSPESVTRWVWRACPAGLVLLAVTSCSGTSGSETPLSSTEVVRAEVVLPTDSVLVGDSLLAQVRTTNRSGATVTWSGSGWTSGDTTVGVVSETGVIRARNIGTVTISAAAGGLPATREVRIVSRPITLTLTSPDTVNVADDVVVSASVTTSTGVPLPEVAPRFVSTDTSVVAIASRGPGKALVTLRTGGQAELLAIVGRDTSRRPLTVRLGNVAQLGLVVDPRIVDIGDSVPFTFLARNAAGELVSPRGAVLSPEPAGVMTVRNGYLVATNPGRAVLRARYGTLTARDTLTALGPSTFQLDLVDGNPQVPLPARIVASMARVTQRWRRVIRSSPPGAFVRLALNECRNSVAVATFVPGLRVLIKLDTLSTRIAGQGGPCIVREGGLPILGTIQINALTWSSLSDRKIDDLIQHEVGHVLGIGSVWLFPPQSDYLSGDSDAADPIFVGPLALTAFAKLGNSALFSGRPIPVEIRTLGHWRSTAFGTEVMSPTLVNVPQVTSAVTVATLADMGWDVELEAYDEYTLPPAVLSSTVSPRVVGAAVTPVVGQALDGDVLLPQIMQMASGVKVPITAVKPRGTIQR